VVKRPVEFEVVERPVGFDMNRTRRVGRAMKTAQGFF
jgi:hypothetical protein